MNTTKLRFGFLLLALAAGALRSSAEEARNIGSRLEMFVDKYLIDRMEGTSLKLNTPTYAGTALKFDDEWDGACAGFVAVIKDGDIYRMYYVGLPYKIRSDNKETCVCYAESRDGITWTKPKLGLVEYQGSKANNIVLPWDPAEGYAHNFSPFLDTRPGVNPAERFKAVGSGSNGWPERILYTIASPDGIHWKKMGASKKFPIGRFDTQNCAFWSETENCYVLYCREYPTTDPVWDMARRLAEDKPGSKIAVPNRGKDFTWRHPEGFRTMVKATSQDGVNWENQRRVSFGDTPMEELYTFHILPYFRAPYLYIGMPMRYVPYRRAMTRDEYKSLNVIPTYGEEDGVENEVSDTVFMTSRGGYSFDRTFMEGFVRPGLDLKNWISRNGMVATGTIQTSPTELSIYVQEHFTLPTARLARYTIRLDGFASVHASYEGGEMVTKPIIFDGKELVLNYSTSAAGGISVEIQDADGEQIPGFTLEESEVIIGDRIERVVKWRDGDLKQFAGRPVRLRFVMKDADLYSIRFR